MRRVSQTKEFPNRKRGPLYAGLCMHYRIGFVDEPKFRTSMAELRSQIVAAQERALYYACELRSCAPFR